MKRALFFLPIIIILSMACSLGGLVESTETPAQVSEKRCGDQVCDGPENPNNCPQDCKTAAPLMTPIETGIAPLVSPETQITSEADFEEQVDSGYRYVSFGGDIHTAQNPSINTEFVGTAFDYSGIYQIELWFPIEGGDVVQQRNTIALTEFKDLYFGNPECTPCEWVLDETSFNPVSFNLEAELNLNNIQEDNQLVDELIYQLLELPQAAITGVVGCPCGVPDTFSDPAGIPQMMGFFLEKRTNPIHLNVLEENTYENFAVSPLSFIYIPNESLSYVIVPDLSIQ
jgi:hypothetical protein